MHTSIVKSFVLRFDAYLLTSHCLFKGQEIVPNWARTLDHRCLTTGHEAGISGYRTSWPLQVCIGHLAWWNDALGLFASGSAPGATLLGELDRRPGLCGKYWILLTMMYGFDGYFDTPQHHPPHWGYTTPQALVKWTCPLESEKSKSQKAEFGFSGAFEKSKNENKIRNFEK